MEEDTVTNSEARKSRVLVLFGGRSSEHAVSCVTAAGVLNAIDRERFDPVAVGITSEGQWVAPSVDPRSYSFDGDQLPSVESHASTVQMVTRHDASTETITRLVEIDLDGAPIADLGHVDVVLPLLHGPFGEDGTLQGVLELADLPYAGAGVLASAIGMDKHFMKIAFEAAGLKVGPYETVTARQWGSDRGTALRRLRRLQLPLYVKPARAGSSVGITRVQEWGQLDDAIAEAQRHDPKIVVEQGLTGREIECGVLGGRGGSEPRTSLCGEIAVEGETGHPQFYDFAAKYTDALAASLSCPADLPDEVTEEIRRQSVTAFEALDAEGLSRADFFFTVEGEIVINEVNTMPGFTPISMYPRMWEATGIGYSELITELLELALERPVGLR